MVRNALFFPALLLLPILGATRAFAEPVRITIDTGVLAGSAADGIQTFKGIPYAKPPVGPLRWRPPQPPAAWKEARDATAFGAACPLGGAALEGDGLQTSEDCLTLNVWAPAHADRSSPGAPVMVWLHGGANSNGAGAKRYYDGTAFARDGIVLVSLNYRLGPLGFFAHPALTKEAGPSEPLGSYGLMDQVAALGWVKRNARAFGGDPARVTVFGESAGGEDVLALLAVPSATGLFQQAIVESGPGWPKLPTPALAETLGVPAATAIGITGADAAERLRALPVETALQLAFPSELVEDGRLLPASPAAAFTNHHTAHVPLIIGTNSDEGSLLDGRGDPKAFVASIPALTRELLRRLYGTGDDDATLARALFRDRVFAAPARWIARQAAADAPTYLYRFSYVRKSQRTKVPGASHGSEIPYVFDSWNRSPMGGAYLADEDRAMEAKVHACWVAFAKTGVPAAPGLPAWPRYQAAKDELLEIGTESAVRRGLDAERLDFQEQHTLQQLVGK